MTILPNAKMFYFKYFFFNWCDKGMLCITHMQHKLIVALCFRNYHGPNNYTMCTPMGQCLLGSYYFNVIFIFIYNTFNLNNQFPLLSFSCCFICFLNSIFFLLHYFGFFWSFFSPFSSQGGFFPPSSYFVS